MASLRAILLATLSCLLGLSTAWYNPIRNPGGSDPFLVYTGGYYYLLTTTWTDIEISRATTIAGLEAATKKSVYSTSTPSRCCNVWSPEVHYLGDTWYIYYTAGETTDLDGQRLHVLTGNHSWLSPLHQNWL
jgi:GH43 family beta-xylosidase